MLTTTGHLLAVVHTTTWDPAVCCRPLSICVAVLLMPASANTGSSSMKLLGQHYDAYTLQSRGHTHVLCMPTSLHSDLANNERGQQPLRERKCTIVSERDMGATDAQTAHQEQEMLTSESGSPLGPCLAAPGCSAADMGS